CGSHRLLLLLQVCRRVRLTRLRQLLLRLVDACLRLLEVLVGGAAKGDVQVCLVALQVFASRGDLRLRSFDLCVEGSALKRLQVGLRGLQTGLRLRERALGLLLLSVGLRSLGSDTTVIERIQSGFSGGDLRLRLVDGSLELRLLCRRAAALQQVELTLRR